MRTMRTLLCAAGFVAAAIVASADDAAVKKALDAKYDAFGKAFLAKKADVIGKMTTPDFTYTPFGQKAMNAKQTIALLKQQMAMLPSEGGTVTTKITKLTVKGNTAVAETTGEMTMKMTDPQKNDHTMVAKGTSVDTWRKVGSDWKMCKIVEKSSEMTIDGQKFDPTAPGGGAPPSGEKKP